MNALFPAWALVAWGVTVILVSQLLDGTFDTRSCQTGCVQGLYWGAFVITITGCIAGGWYLLKAGGSKRLFSKISVGALLLLLAMLLTTMGIGTFA